MCEHALRDACTELLCLFADAVEKGISAPSADEHDDADWDIVKVLGHGNTRLDGVGAHFVGFVAEDISTKEFCCLT